LHVQHDYTNVPEEGDINILRLKYDYEVFLSHNHLSKDYSRHKKLETEAEKAVRLYLLPSDGHHEKNTLKFDFFVFTLSFLFFIVNEIIYLSCLIDLDREVLLSA